MSQIVRAYATVAILASVAAAAGAQITNRNELRGEVLEALDALNSATLRGDSAALDRLYADDYVFVTYRGTIENKQHQIELLKSGTMKFTERTASEINVRVFGDDMAIVVYRRRQQATVGGASRPSDVRVTNVWSKTQGRWQLLSGQVTPIQAP